MKKKEKAREILRLGCDKNRTFLKTDEENNYICATCLLVLFLFEQIRDICVRMSDVKSRVL